MALVTPGIEEDEELFIVLLITFFFGKHFSYCCGHFLDVATRVAIFSKPYLVAN
jgi:hypothetical protein